MQQPVSGTREEMFTDLVCAILTVNNWNMDKVAAILPGLRAHNLLRPEYVAAMSVYELAGHLEQAGYHRGDFMVGLLAGRLMNAAQLLAKDEVYSELQMREANHDTTAIRAILSRVNGVGPVVLNIYLRLRGMIGLPSGH